jgi:hypothetical protein
MENPSTGGQPPTSLPEGAVQLSEDEAVQAIVTGNHPGADRGNAEFDSAVVEMIRRGLVSVARLADGQLSFTRTEVGR